MSGQIPDLSGAPAGGAGGGGGLGAGGAGGAGAGGAGGAGGLGGLIGGHALPILIAGGLSGVVAMGALITTGVLPVHPTQNGSTPGRLALVACPDTGPVLAVADPGQQFLVTGRTADGAWLQVYLPGPALPYAWAPAAQLHVTGDTSGLPVAGCEVAAASPPVGTPEVTATPIESPTESASPSPSESASASPTPSPTPKPNQGPVLTGLAASHSTIYYPWGGLGPSCGPDSQNPNTTTLSVTATDHDGVAGVTLFYKLPGGSFKSVAMSHSGSTYSGTVKIGTSDSTAGSMAYYVVAKDKAATPKETTSATKSVTVRKCDLPPTISDSAPFGPNYPLIYVSRAGVAGTDPPCSVFNDSNNYITVKGFASDPDGSVAKMTYFFTPYGGSLRSLALSGSGGVFTGNLLRKYFTKLPNKEGAIYSFPGYLVAYDDLGHHSARLSLGFEEEACSP